MRWVAVIWLAGCNAVFGVHKTGPADAQLFDAIPDAPYACPPPGTTPSFSVYFRQVVPKGSCVGYTLSRTADLAFATCSKPSGDASMFQPSQGAVDSATLVDATLVPTASLGQPKLAPDGDELWATTFDTNGASLAGYSRSGTTWTHAFDVFRFVGQLDAGTPMRAGTTRRVLFHSGNAIHELDQVAPGSWTEINVGVYTLAYLQVDAIMSAPNVTPDGLRMVFGARVGVLQPRLGVFYADRATLADPFGPAVRIDAVPDQAGTPFLTEDCSRLYFSGLRSVLYVPQQ